MKEKNIQILNTLFETYPKLKECKEDIVKSFEILAECYKNGGKVLICGNGGSAADSEHISGELLKSFKIKRPVPADKAEALKKFDNGEYIAEHLEEGLCALPLISFTSLGTAFANDAAPDLIFAQLVNAMGKEGDVLIGISTSGNSGNVINALKVAKVLGVKTVGLAGAKGGLLADMSDACVKVPAFETYAIQEYHLPVYHALCAMIEEEFYGE